MNKKGYVVQNYFFFPFHCLFGWFWFFGGGSGRVGLLVGSLTCNTSCQFSSLGDSLLEQQKDVSGL